MREMRIEGELLDHTSIPSFANRIAIAALVGSAAYWFLNATVWIPWVYSRNLGSTEKRVNHGVLL